MVKETLNMLFVEEGLVNSLTKNSHKEPYNCTIAHVLKPKDVFLRVFQQLKTSKAFVVLLKNTWRLRSLQIINFFIYALFVCTA